MFKAWNRGNGKNGLQLKEGRIRLGIRKNFCSEGGLGRLPRDVVGAPFLETFKISLYQAHSSLIELWVSLFIAEELD